VQQVADVEAVLQGAEVGQSARYTILRLGTREVVDLRIAPIPSGPRVLYYVLAAVGIFTLLIGAAVRLQRPRDPATVHFFWLCVAFFGVFTFPFSGRLDRLDWVFYWADAVSVLVLPPLFLHFTLVFPERPRSWARSSVGRAMLPLLYAPAAIAGLARIVAVARAPMNPVFFTDLVGFLDRFDLLYLSACLAAGL